MHVSQVVPSPPHLSSPRLPRCLRSPPPTPPLWSITDLSLFFCFWLNRWTSSLQPTSLSLNNLLDVNHSDLRSGHLTDTALLMVVQSLQAVKTVAQSSVLVLFDLSSGHLWYSSQLAQVLPVWTNCQASSNSHCLARIIDDYNHEQ